MRRVLPMSAFYRAFLMVAAIAMVSSFLSSCGDTDQFSISGQVTSGGSGVAGVTMTLSGANSATVTTDANGKYAFGSLEEGDYTITPSKSGFTFTPAISAQTIKDTDISAVNFTAANFPIFSISGTATAGNIRVADVTMMLSGSGSGTVKTDATGTYTFSGLANGSYTITPSKTSFAFNPAGSSQTVNGANLTSVNFTATIVSTFSIFGTVTSGSSGLSGVTMTLSGAGAATATTDTHGNYLFTGLVNSKYTITPSKTGFAFSPTSSSQTLSGANVTSLNFIATSTQAQIVTCPLSGTINVTIRDYIFSPQTVTTNVNRIVKWANNGPSLHTVTSGSVPNSDGKFDSGSLEAGSEVCVQFLAVGVYPYFSVPDTSMTGSVTVN